MKTYEGYIDDDQSYRVRVWENEDGPSRPLDPRFDVRNHSPTGFAWGYGGSGPAQLALALAADALGDDDQAVRDALSELLRDRGTDEPEQESGRGR